MSDDLTDVIEDAVSDAVSPEPEGDVSPSTSDVSTEVSTEVSPETSVTEDTSTSSEVESPAAKSEDPPVDDAFAKQHGLPPQVPGQRENRLPYSRVKKIVENAEKKATLPLQTQLAELGTKVKDYEDRLAKVGEFEKVMVQEPARFLEMLNQIPAYAQIFSQLQRKADAETASAAAPAEPLDDMPQPDRELPDGSKVYSLEGLKALNAWNREQAKKEVMSEVQKTFGPIHEQWEAQQRIQAMIPEVQRQIDEARSWPQFKENEDAIVAALAANERLSLEGAYRQVVFPKLQTDEKKLRDEIRQQVLRDLKKAPATSAPSGGVRPQAAARTGGPRNLEDVIKESMESLKS